MGSTQLFLQHEHRPEQPALPRRAVVEARRLHSDAGADRSRVCFLGMPGRYRCSKRMESDRHSRAHLLSAREVLTSDGLPHDPRCRTGTDARDGFPSAICRAYPQFHGVSRILAGAAVQQRGGDRGVLGLPRAGGDARSVAVAEIRDHGSRCRILAAILRDARHAQAGDGPSRLYGDVLRARRDDRWWNGVPARAEQLPLDRRRRFQRIVAATAGREDGVQGLGALVDGPNAQHRGARPEEPGDPEGHHLDAARAALNRRVGMV